MCRSLSSYVKRRVGTRSDALISLFKSPLLPPDDTTRRFHGGVLLSPPKRPGCFQKNTVCFDVFRQFVVVVVVGTSETSEMQAPVEYSAVRFLYFSCERWETQEKGGVETKGGGHVGRNLVNGEQLEKTAAPWRYAPPAPRSRGFHACFSRRLGDFILPLSPFFF